MSKSNPATLGLAIGDLLQWEATPLTRIVIDAPLGTKAGSLVNYTPRGMLVALTAEFDGKVVVQPHNCIINAGVLSATVINAQLGGTEEEPKTLDDLAVLGDGFGIVYRGAVQD